MDAVFFTTVMLTWFGIRFRTMIGTFSGIKDEAISTRQSRLHILRGRQLSRRHQLSMHQGIVQNTR